MGTNNSTRYRIYIISGGVGASGEQLVQTVLAQFPQSQVEVVIIPNVRGLDQIQRAVRRARENEAFIVHTLVDSRLRAGLIEEARRQVVVEIDLMGSLLGQLSVVLAEKPAEQPGLYRKLNKSYYERITAIEYTLAHDDGKNLEGWQQADVMILGVSRTGKTPISLYLSVLGWRVANYPVVPEIAMPKELEALDPRRVIGLDIEAGQLVQHRQQRQSRLGAPGPTAYTDPQVIYAELEEARHLFRRKGFTIIDVTDKPVESCADEVIRLLTKTTRPYRGGLP